MQCGGTISLYEKGIHEANEALGTIPNKQQHILDGINGELEEIIQRKGELYQNLLITQDRTQKVRVRREVKKIVMKPKTDLWNKKYEDIKRYISGTKR